MAHRTRRLGEVAAVVAIAIAVVVVVAIKLLDQPTRFDYARVIDDHTLVLGTVTGPGTWTRVTSVQEASDRVVIGISSLRAPLPGTGDDLVELTVHLAEPIGEKTVTDASTGREVPRTHCLPPAYLAPGCT
jgi:hypothetical protein